MSIGKIAEFKVHNDDWRLYVERLEQYFLVNKIPNELQVPTLITVMGAECYELLVNLCTPVKPKSKTLEQIVDVMEKHLQPKPSELAERYKFRHRKQKEGETISEYAAILKKMTKTCEFGSWLEESLRDQLVCGITNETIRQRLFAESNLDFGKAYTLAVSMEAAEKDAAAVEGQRESRSDGSSTTSSSVPCQAMSVGSRRKGTAVVATRDVRGARTSFDATTSSGRGRGARALAAPAPMNPGERAQQQQCRVCGARHDASKCKFGRYVCRVCNQVGHLRRMCPNLSEHYNVDLDVLQIKNPNESDGAESDEVIFVDVCKLSATQCSPIYIELNVNGIDIKMECDTGSAVSCISWKCYSRLFNHVKLKPSNLTLKYYTGELVKPLGVIQPLVKYKKWQKQLDLYVVENGKTLLLGRQWMAELKIQLPTVTYDCNSNDVVMYKDNVFDMAVFSSKYCEVFADGLGRFTGGTVSVRVREGARPVFMRARPLAYALREPVERALDQLQRDGILSPVERSDWATPIVPVVKKDDKPRATRTASSDQTNSTRKEPFTHLSEKELIKEANRVRAQAEGITCTSDHPPEKFFSLPHRRIKENRIGRRNSDEGAPEKTPLGRSTSDVSGKKRKERTSLSTLFRRAQTNKGLDAPVVVATKPITVVKRSKSDVSDLKSNTSLNTQNKPVRKRSGSETEEFLKSLRNKKTQLSPIIESSPRDDYFKKTSPLDLYQQQKSVPKENKFEDTQTESKKVNPVEKPPRYKTPDKPEPKAPSRAKKSKSQEKEKEKSPQITETPKRKTEVKKTLLVDEIDTTKNKEIHPVEDRIKDSIRKIEENVYGDKEMIHSSQQPPDKPPLTRGHTVDHLVRILREDQSALPPKSHLISPPNGTNTNQPFSYLKPSVSPDPNLFVRNTSPDRVPSPINKMDKGVVYAHVVRDHDSHVNRLNKQTVHKTYSPSREKYGNFSDEDEGLGYEERHKFTKTRMYDYDYKNKENDNFNTYEPTYNVTDSPIRPRFREYKLTSFEEFEPTYANEYSPKDKSPDMSNQYRGRGDGMDTKKKHHEPETTKLDLDFNELSHRRHLLESRLNARRLDRERNIEEPISRYLPEDPIYEAEKRMKATERYVNETVRYFRNTLERDGFTESSATEDYSKYDSDNHKIKYNTESRTFQKVPKGELDRREFIDTLEPRFKGNKKDFPPEPEYEPPSLDSNTGKPLLSPIEYKEKKYKAKKQLTSSHDVLQTGQKYKGKDEYFGKRKGHYSSNPEIAQEREEDYANLPKYADSYHSLRRVKNKDRYKEEIGMRRHDSGDSRDYYRDDRSPRRFDIDNRLVDSGIENDFRKDSSGEIHRTRHRHESDDDVRDTSLFLASERQHTEDNYPTEQIYANGEYLARFKDYRDEGYRKEYTGRDRSADEGSHCDPKINRYDKSPSRLDDKVSAKPPKAKKLTGLEKMKQLFSRDSSKKSKKEKEIVQPKTRTRVLKSPEHLARDDSEYRRYTDPEPSDIVVKKIDYDCKADERRYRSSREDLDRYRSSDPRDSDPERKYREEYNGRYDKTLTEDRRYKERKEEKRRYHSSDRESDRQSRPSDGDSDLRKFRSKPLDSPALAERYRERRRLATPSPTPSPPRRQTAPTPPAGNWFKSLDRLTRKKGNNIKVEKESILTTEDEAPRKTYPKSAKPLTSPAKNLRFFGDTDPDSDANVKPATETKRYTHTKHGTLRKTISNSSTGLDEVDHSELTNKSYSLSNLHRDEKSESPNTKQYKRNLQNISEIQSNSETESQFDRKVNAKPPISPYERSRSHSSSKTLKGSKDVRRRHDDRGSSSELRGSKQELTRDLKHRRRTPVTNSGESSTEGDSSHQSQRSVVYLHATTVGDIPDPGRVTRNRSRDDVSSVNSSNLQVRSTTKSFSIFAPWTPKHYNDQHDVHYAQRPRKSKPKEIVKKASSTKTLTEEKPATLQKNKSYSQTTLTRRPQNNRLTSSSTTLYKKSDKRIKDTSNTTPRKSVARDGKKSQSSELISRENDRERVSRSISITFNA